MIHHREEFISPAFCQTCAEVRLETFSVDRFKEGVEACRPSLALYFIIIHKIQSIGLVLHFNEEVFRCLHMTFVWIRLSEE